MLLAHIANKQGDPQARDIEGSIAAQCVEGLFSTGDGSAARPYLVTRTSDEYDVLDYLEKKPAAQALVEHDGRRDDRFDCADGTVIHFDITDAYQRLAERRQGERLDS